MPSITPNIKMLIAVYTTLLLQVQAIKMIFNVNGYEKVYQLYRKKLVACCVPSIEAVQWSLRPTSTGPPRYWERNKQSNIFMYVFTSNTLYTRVAFS